MRNAILLVSVIQAIVCSCAKDQNSNVSFSNTSVVISANGADFTFNVELEASDKATEFGIILSKKKITGFLDSRRL